MPAGVMRPAAAVTPEEVGAEGALSVETCRRLLSSCTGAEWGGAALSSLMRTGIMRACQVGDVEVIRLMHAMGVDVSKRTESPGDEWNPLQQAAVSGKANCSACLASILKDMSGALNAQSDAVPAAVHLAAMFGHVDVLQSLSDAGGDLQLIRAKNGSPEIAPTKDWTAADYAAYYGKYEVVEFLWDKGAIPTLALNDLLGKAIISPSRCILFDPWLELNQHRIPDASPVESSDRKAQLVKRIAKWLFFDSKEQPHMDLRKVIPLNVGVVASLGIVECSCEPQSSSSSSTTRFCLSSPPANSSTEDHDDLRAWRDMHIFYRGDALRPLFLCTETRSTTHTWTYGSPWNMNETVVKSYKCLSAQDLGHEVLSFSSYPKFYDKQNGVWIHDCGGIKVGKLTACEYVCSSWLPRVAMGGDCVLMNALLDLLQHRKPKWAVMVFYRQALQKATYSNHVEMVALLLDRINICPAVTFGCGFPPLLHQALWMQCSREMIDMMLGRGSSRDHYHVCVYPGLRQSAPFGYGESVMVQGATASRCNGVYAASGMSERKWTATQRSYHSPLWVKHCSAGDGISLFYSEGTWIADHHHFYSKADDAGFNYNNPFGIVNWFDQSNDNEACRIRVRPVILPTSYKSFMKTYNQSRSNIIINYSGQRFQYMTPVEVAASIGNDTELIKFLSSELDVIPQVREHPKWRLQRGGRAFLKTLKRQMTISCTPSGEYVQAAGDSGISDWYPLKDVEPIAAVTTTSKVRSAYRSIVGRAPFDSNSLETQVMAMFLQHHFEHLYKGSMDQSAFLHAVFKKGKLSYLLTQWTSVSLWNETCTFDMLRSPPITRRSPHPPLHTAVRYGHGHVLDAVLENEKRTDSYDGKLLTKLEFLQRYSGTTVQWEAAWPPSESLYDLNQVNYRGLTPLAVAAGLGDVGMVKKLLATRKVDVRKSGRHGRSAAFMAASHGHVEVLSLLFEAGAHMGDADTRGRSPSFIAAANGHVAVLEAMMRYSEAAREESEMREEDLRSIEQLESTDEEDFGLTFDQPPPIREANPEVNRTFDVFAPRTTSTWPRDIQRSLQKGHSGDRFKITMTYGPDFIDAVVVKGHAPVVRWWIKLRVNKFDPPVVRASSASEEFTKMFKDDRYNKLADLVYLASHFDRPQVLGLLYLECIRCYDELSLSMSCSHLRDPAYILSTSLLLAVNNAAHGSARTLIRLGAAANSASPERNALFNATKKYDDLIASALIAATNAKAKQKMEGKIEATLRIIDLLLRHGADANVIQSYTEITPLAVACTTYHSTYSSRIVKILLDHGAAINPACERTPLRQAIEHTTTNQDAVELCRELISLGADVNHVGVDGSNPPIYYLIPSNCWESKVTLNLGALRVLLDGGADINQPNVKGRLFLYEVLYSGLKRPWSGDARENIRKVQVVVTAIVNRGWGIDEPNPAGNEVGKTPLFEAAAHTSFEMVNFLCEYGADPCRRSSNGESVGYQVVFSEESVDSDTSERACKTLSALCDHGFDLESACTDDDGTILQEILNYVARSCSYEEISQRDTGRIYRCHSAFLNRLFKYLVKLGACEALVSPGGDNWKRCLFKMPPSDNFYFSMNAVNRRFLPSMNRWAVSMMVDQVACAAALGILHASNRVRYKRYLIRRFPTPKKRGLIHDAEYKKYDWLMHDPNGTPTRPESPSATLRALLHIPELRRLVVSFLVCSSAASRKFIREMAVQHGVDHKRAQRLLDEL